MKKTLLRTVFAVALGLAGSQFAAAAEPRPEDAKPRIPPERVELKVLKVFYAKDGEFIFRAYVVEWKGQEVIVRDTLAKTNYRTDDTITVMVMKHPFPQNKEEYGLLNFEIVPLRPQIK